MIGKEEMKMMSINSIFVPLLANCIRQVEAVYKQKYTPTVPLEAYVGKKNINKKG